MTKIEITYDEVLHASFPFAVALSDGQLSVVGQLTKKELLDLRDQLDEAINAYDYESERRS